MSAQPAGNNRDIAQGFEKQKAPLELDLSSIQSKSGKATRANSSFSFIPIDSLPFTDDNSLTAQSQRLESLRGRHDYYAVGYSITLDKGDL